MPKRYLVLNADDLGQQLSCNAGILKAATEGLLTSASLRANGLAYDNARKEIIPACPHIGIGAHICLNEGAAVSPSSKDSLLFDSWGNFRFLGVKGFIQIALRGIEKKFREEVRTEIRCQVEKLLSDIEIDHIDGHFHIHAIPWIFTITVEIAEEYNIPFIRIPSEPFLLSALSVHFPSFLNFSHYFNLKLWCIFHKKYIQNRKIQSNDYFYGLLHSSIMNVEVTKSLLCNNSYYGIIEMLHHPASYVCEEKYLHEYVKEFCLSKNRNEELDALVSEDIKKIINDKEYILCNYKKLSQLITR